jgi:hypothetical protein
VLFWVGLASMYCAVTAEIENAIMMITIAASNLVLNFPFGGVVMVLPSFISKTLKRHYYLIISDNAKTPTHQRKLTQRQNRQKLEKHFT